MSFKFPDLTDTIAGPNYRKEVDSVDSADREIPEGFVLYFEHVPTGRAVHFKAFIKEFNDQYKSEWGEESVFGRMDDIYNFKKTGRKITLSWDIPSHSEEEAASNFKECSKFLGLLYPLFEEINATTSFNGNEIQNKVGLISAPPIFKVKFVNLIATSTNNPLYCVLDGLNYSPNMDSGFFLSTAANKILYPKLVSFSCNINVIHTDKLGWIKSEQSDQNPLPRGFPDDSLLELFPYGSSLITPTSPQFGNDSSTVITNAKEEVTSFIEQESDNDKLNNS